MDKSSWTEYSFFRQPGGFIFYRPIFGKGSPMRFSIHATGIPEIDHQHRQIDDLIAQYRKAANRAAEQHYLQALLQTTKAHFLFLEHFFDVKFPDEFRSRQEQILDWLTEKIQQRNRNEMGQQELADELHRVFLLNASVQEPRLQALH